MRRSRFGSKTKNSQSSHHISFYSRVRVGYEESTLKVRERCASRAYPKVKDGSVPQHGDKLRAKTKEVLENKAEALAWARSLFKGQGKTKWSCINLFSSQMHARRALSK
eukprot:4564661-Pleurochrysis_carterae.AAC.1